MTFIQENAFENAVCKTLPFFPASEWANDDFLSIRPQRTYLKENLFEIQRFSFKKLHLKILSAKSHPFCLGPNVLNFISFDAPLLRSAP